ATQPLLHPDALRTFDQVLLDPRAVRGRAAPVHEGQQRVLGRAAAPLRSHHRCVYYEAMGPTAGGQTDELLRLLRRARPDLELGEEDAAYLGQRLASAREAWPELGGEGGGAAQASAH